jgi:dinuclear metal center YbgI/SA1388 family protein
MANLRDIIALLDQHLAPGAEIDYPGAWNGLQLEGRPTVASVSVAVDCSERTIELAIAEGAHLLLVHHGLFWDAERRITGPIYRKLSRLIRAGLSVYASHLPLDRHPDFGNSARLLRAIGLEPDRSFGHWKGEPVGWSAPADLSQQRLADRIAMAIPSAPLRTLLFGPTHLTRIACVTGSGADLMPAAAEEGIFTLLTGEASHQHFNQARELKLNLFLAGHYATETFGVRAVGDHVATTFGIPVTFIDDPSPF